MLLSVAVLVLLVFPQRSPDSRDAEDSAVGLARTTLSDRLQIPEDRIRLGHASAKQWPDASLGCPEKGMVYAQVVTPGYWVQLQVDEKVYDIRVGNGRALVCEPKLESGPRKTYVGTMARLYNLARHDLAGRLKVGEKDVRVSSVRAQTWPDAGLGCGDGDTSPSPGETRGFLIELSHDGKAYEYHSDTERVVLCTPLEEEPRKE
jgi:hypothetical protein